MKLLKKNDYVVSDIKVKCKLLTDMKSVRKNIELSRDFIFAKSTRLKYILRERPDLYYIVSFDKDSIEFGIYSSGDPLRCLDDALLRLFDIMAILSSDYEVTINGLYPYLIRALAGKPLSFYEEKIPQKRTDSGTDLILARRISTLMDANAKLDADSKRLYSQLGDLFYNSLAFRHGHGMTIDSITNSLGLDNDIIKRLIADGANFGYKIVHSDSENFDLVKL